MCVLQHLLIHTRSATNQLSPDYIHDKSAERKATCFLNICLYRNEYMPICVNIINLASKQYLELIKNGTKYFFSTEIWTKLV